VEFSCKLLQLWKIVSQYLLKLSINIAGDPDMSCYTKHKMCADAVHGRYMFILALCKITPNCQQPKCITKLWCFNWNHTAMNISQPMLQVTTWINPADVILSRRSQVQKTTCYRISFMYNSKASQINSCEVRAVIIIFREVIGGGSGKGIRVFMVTFLTWSSWMVTLAYPLQ
jgi:hypothetical protein